MFDQLHACRSRSRAQAVSPQLGATLHFVGSLHGHRGLIPSSLLTMTLGYRGRAAWSLLLLTLAAPTASPLKLAVDGQTVVDQLTKLATFTDDPNPAVTRILFTGEQAARAPCCLPAAHPACGHQEPHVMWQQATLPLPCSGGCHSVGLWYRPGHPLPLPPPPHICSVHPWQKTT